MWSVDRKIYKPEIARTSFLKKKLLELQGDDADASIALSTAIELWEETTGSAVKKANELKEADFDDLVTFWSR